MLEKYIGRELDRVYWQKFYRDFSVDEINAVLLEYGKESVQRLFYDYVHNIETIIECEREGCKNEVRFTGFSTGYSRFCCIKCSKNEETLRNINLFNGVHKIRSKPSTEKTQYFKEARRLTDINYKLYKHIINPNNLLLGRAGVNGAHQIDPYNEYIRRL